MSLSIKNSNHLTSSEVTALANCNLASEVIALQTDAEGATKIVKLSRDQLTCWQQFLKCFGLGNLANLEFGLKKVAAHCNQYQWSEAARLDPSSNLHLAYMKVCALANKALYYKWDDALYHNVAANSIEKRVEFVQYRNQRLLNRSDLLKSIKWNPALKVADVKAILARQFPDSLVRVEDQNRQPLSNNSLLSLDALRRTNLYVEQRLYPELREHPVIFPVPVPVHPHHRLHVRVPTGHVHAHKRAHHIH